MPFFFFLLKHLVGVFGSIFLLRHIEQPNDSSETYKKMEKFTNFYDENKIGERIKKAMANKRASTTTLIHFDKKQFLGMFILFSPFFSVLRFLMYGI